MALWLKTASGMVPVGGDGSYLTVTPWTALTFAGNWVNYGGIYETGQYRKVGDNVEVRGLIKLSTGSIAPSVQTTIATLPVGFRPSQDVIVDALLVEGGGTEEICQVRISSAGVIAYLNVVGATLTTAGYIVLNSLTFSTTAVGAVPKYSEVPNKGSGATADYTGSFSLTTTVQVITFGSNISDPVGEYTFNNGLGRLFVTNSGLYHVEYNISYQNGTAGALPYVQYFLRRNGSINLLEHLRTCAGSYDSGGQGMVIRLTAGDFLDSTIVQTSGGTGILRAGSRMSIHKIRD